ncbi:hypothetical protein UB31_18900 [Bradyrhizobium sp. LTSP849]|uniref:hypothetical protein n=1 Tax=Bradyrhizobium sp. LTSP849 TaxID=1615890 RepID=UPI0005D1435C|nr:hypothetical protein [Bradyrhizobium sp. LTSP849]KJC47324.1 hypothetical protein UB31_18900 [Bradyrhizobium sp. LTSP849]
MTGSSTAWRGPNLPATPLHLTLEEAASRQVDAAIDALQRGDFDVALTLAGAAEGMIKRDGQHMFSWLRDNPKAAERFPDKKQWINVLNRELYWLKHGGEETMEIDCATTVFMIARAMTKLEVWTPKMDGFKPWLISNLDNL